MIRGVHTMFYNSQAEELREFLRDKFGFPCTDVGYGLAIHFRVPGDFELERYQPRYK